MLTLCCFRGVYAGDEIHGSADVSYRSTETKTAGEKKSTWSLDQVYNLGLTKEFTPKVNFTADLGINVTESVTETDDTKTEDKKTTRLYPDMRLNVSNEYFDADAGYRLDERGLDILTAGTDEDRSTTESWNYNLYTRLEKYPRVRLRYNQDRSYDDLLVHETNTQTNRFSGSADYAFRFLNFYYDYTNEISDNYVEDSTRETNTNDGRIDFRKSFWSNRITSYGSYSINERKTEFTTRAEDVQFPEIEAASDGLYEHDYSPLGDPLRTGIEDLKDGNKTDEVVVDVGPPPTYLNIGGSGNTYQNIGLDLNDQTEIEEIRLYTKDVSFTASDFIWAVYYSNDNQPGTTWTEITSSASFEYDTDQDRFKISFARTKARYFKVVNINNDGTVDPIYVTEIEAYSISTQAPYTTAEEVATTQTLQANLGFKPFDWLSFTYDLNQDRRKTETETDSTTTRQSRQYISGLLGKGFQVHKYLEIRPQYQKRLEYEEKDSEDSEEETTRRSTDTYRLHFVSSPLKTLDTDLSLNHWVLQEESETQSRTSSALLHIAARLREGADLDIDGDITRSENLSTEPESTSTSKSIHSNLRLELTTVLTTEIEYNMNWSETETEGSSGDTTAHRTDAEVTFYWRPSHDFYFRGSYAVDRDEESGDETSRQNYNMNWLLTKKVQLSMDYAIQSNDTDKTNFSSDLSWNLSQMFTLRFGYDWSRQEADTKTETQTITANLSARF